MGHPMYGKFLCMGHPPKKTLQVELYGHAVRFEVRKIEFNAIERLRLHKASTHIHLRVRGPSFAYIHIEQP
jgi:hypothetical protein